MNTREQDETQELLDDLDLQKIMDHLQQRKEKLAASRNALNQTIKTKFTETDKEPEKEKNKKQSIKATAGNNNLILVLDHTHYVILFSDTRQTAANVDKLSPDSPPNWLPREYWKAEITDAPFYKKQDIKFRRNFDTRYNHFEEKRPAGSFLSASVTEYFPTSLHDKVIKPAQNEENTQTEPQLTDEQRIDLACDIYQQLSSAYSYLEKKKYLWLDLKPGNIMIREDGSIGIPDKKAFCAYEDVLISSKIPYSFIVAKDDKEFKDLSKQLEDGKFLIMAPKKADSDIVFCFNNSENKIEQGKIDNKELKSRFANEIQYEKFINKIMPNQDNEEKKINLNTSQMAAILEAIPGKIKKNSKPITYTPNFEYLTFTEYFCSQAFIDPSKKRIHHSCSTAKNEFIKEFQMEYSYQLAATLYITLTGEEGKFDALKKNMPLDFNYPVFESEKGQKLKTLIEKLTDPVPENRMSYKDGLEIINQIRPPLERKIETAVTEREMTINTVAEPINTVDEPEIAKRPSLKGFGKRLSQSGKAFKMVITEEKEKPQVESITKTVSTNKPLLNESNKGSPSVTDTSTKDSQEKEKENRLRISFKFKKTEEKARVKTTKSEKSLKNKEPTQTEEISSSNKPK